MKNRKFVTLKLERRLIPYLLGSARLGITLEDWCNALTASSGFDVGSDSARWIGDVACAINSIKKQSGDIKENYGMGDEGVWLEDIEREVSGLCEQNQREFGVMQAQSNKDTEKMLKKDIEP